MGIGPDVWGLAVGDRTGSSLLGSAWQGVAVMEGRGLALFGPVGYGMDRTGMAVGERTGLSGYGTVGMVVATIGSHGEPWQGDAWPVWAVE